MLDIVMSRTMSERTKEVTSESCREVRQASTRRESTAGKTSVCFDLIIELSRFEQNSVMEVLRSEVT